MTASLGRPFLTIWFGQTISLIGSAVSAVGVAVWVFLETGSAAWLGMLAALAALPVLLAGPFLPIVDRYPRRTMMIAADTVATLGTIVALCLAVAGRLEVWHLVVAAFVGGAGSAFQFPAFQAAVPLLVDREGLGRANGLNQFGPAVGIVVGPVVATPLVAWWGITAVLIVDVVTFAVAIGCTVAVGFDDQRDSGSGATDAAPAAPNSDDGSWGSAWVWMRVDGRPLVTLLIVLAITNFVLAFFNIALIALATTLGGAARAGLVLGAGGVSMLAGSVVLGRRGIARRRMRTLAVTLGAAGVGCLVAAARPSFLLLVLGVMIALGMVPAVNATVSTIFHEQVPPRMQGRVFGLRAAIGRGLESIGSVVAGFVIVMVAEPAMTTGSIGADTVGRLIGVGPERGAAAVLVAVGVALVALATWVARSSVGVTLEPATEAPAVVAATG